MRRLDPCLAPAGYSPRRYETLSPAPVLDMGERMTDLRDIQALFANGEQGGYWPADPAYAYEDSAGTISASRDGVVGLRLDLSRNLSSTLPIVNQLSFSEDTTQNRSAYSVTSSEQAIALAPDGRMSATRIVGTTINYAYWFIPPFLPSLPLGTAMTFSLYLRSDTPFDVGIRCHGGTNDVVILASVTTEWTRFSITDAVISVTNAFNFGIDFRPGIATGAQAGTVYVAHRQIQVGALTDFQETGPVLGKPFGNHATQATTANKPYLRRTPISNVHWYDSNTYTGALTATFASALGSACTIASVTPEGVSILENQTVGSTYNICPPFGYNGDVLIINRALTAAEKALVARVMQRNVPTLGSNLIIDPDFDSPALWTTDGNAAVSGGCATFTNAVIGDGTYVRSTNDYSFSTDIFYWIKIKNSSYSSGHLSLAREGFEVIGRFSLINDNFMAKKMNSIIGTKLQLYQVWNGSNLTVSVDSLSIKGIF